jgi:hypothetical protein
MDEQSIPPWTAGPDEVVVPATAGFGACETAVTALVVRGGGKIVQKNYTTSQQWGKILRAKAVFTKPGPSTPSLVMCWSKSDPNVELFVNFLD